MSRKTNRAKRRRKTCILLTSKRYRHERRKKLKDRDTKQVTGFTLDGGSEYAPHILAIFRPNGRERRKAHGKTLDYKTVVALRRKAKMEEKAKAKHA